MASREESRILEIDYELSELTRTHRIASLELARTKASLKRLEDQRKALILEKDSLSQGQLMFDGLTDPKPYILASA